MIPLQLNPCSQSPSIRSFETCYQSIPHTEGRLAQTQQGTFETISKTPAYIFGEKVIAPILEKTEALFQKLDALFAKGIAFVPVAKADNTGLIAWFEGDCPDGWVDYQKLQGRVALGVGSYEGIAEDGRKEKAVRAVGDTGGEISHNLTKKEMPGHVHGHSKWGWWKRFDSRQIVPDGPPYYGGVNFLVAGHLKWSHSPNYNSIVENELRGAEQGIKRVEETSLFVGGDQHHNNMPPYLALRACQKVQEEEYVAQKEYDRLRKQFLALTDSHEKQQNKLSLIEELLSSQSSSLETALSDINSYKNELSGFRYGAIGIGIAAITGVASLFFSFYYLRK